MPKAIHYEIFSQAAPATSCRDFRGKQEGSTRQNQGTQAAEVRLLPQALFSEAISERTRIHSYWLKTPRVRNQWMHEVIPSSRQAESPSEEAP